MCTVAKKFNKDSPKVLSQHFGLRGDQQQLTNWHNCVKEGCSYVKILGLDGDGSFRANRGSETLKTVSD